MKRFSDLFAQLEFSLSNKSKIQALRDYLKLSSTLDSSWSVFFLLANRLPKTINGSELLALAQEVSELPDWLVQESYQHVGDICETSALIIKPKLSIQAPTMQLNEFIEQEILPLKTCDLKLIKSKIVDLWTRSDFETCLALNKLLTSTLRFPINAQHLTLVLSEIAGLPQSTIAARLTGKWVPTEDSFVKLISPHSVLEQNSVSPQTFHNLHSLESKVDQLGNSTEFNVYKKFDGVRVQLVKVAQSCLIWSEDQQELSKALPELCESASQFLPLNTILDGEIVAWKDSCPLSHSSLQRRLSRKQASKKQQSEIPIKFIAHDILFFEGRDLRTNPLTQRSEILEQLFSDELPNELGISLSQQFVSWGKLQQHRSESVNCDIILRAKNSVYQTNENEKNWWLWKREPSTILTVLLYSSMEQKRGIESTAEYTFAVWKDEKLVPIAKIREKLDEDLETYLAKFISENTIERFGPVRTLKSELIFEITYEGVTESSRHKSGVALRNPGIKRLCKEKSLKDAANLTELKLQIKNK